MTVLPQLARSSTPRIITVCVDDYGLHDGVNQAALDLMRRRRVSAISCLVEGPAWRTGAQSLLAQSADVEVGLHLNFTEDFGQGGCTPLTRLIGLASARRLDRAQIRARIRRQFDRFEQALGRVPDFVDGHQHVHQLPVIRDVLIEVMNHRSGDARPWLRSTRAPRGCINADLPLAVAFKSALIGWLGARRLSTLAQRHGYPQNKGLVGVYGFDLSEAGYLKKLRAWLGCVGNGDVLMCHPSVPWSGSDPLQHARTQEYRALSSEAFSALLEAAAVEVRPSRRA